MARNDDGSLSVRVTAVPEDGKANAALVELLADRLKIPGPAYTLSGDDGHATRSYNWMV